MGYKGSKLWTDRELQILKDNYLLGIMKLREILPNRPLSSIKDKLSDNNLILPPSSRGHGYNAEAVAALSETSKAYMAGLFDGEGMVAVRKRVDESTSGKKCYYTLRTQISNTNPDPLDMIYDIWGGGINKRIDIRGGNRRPIYDWILTSSKAADFLTAVLPYLIIKKNEAILAIEFQSTLNYNRITEDILKYRESISTKISLLKGRIRS